MIHSDTIPVRVKLFKCLKQILIAVCMLYVCLMLDDVKGYIK